jgi:hypothetical protein
MSMNNDSLFCNLLNNVSKSRQACTFFVHASLVHFLKINFPFEVELRFPSNLDNCKSKCCSQIWCKKYYGVFCYHEIIMSIITADYVDRHLI